MRRTYTMKQFFIARTAIMLCLCAAGYGAMRLLFGG